MKPGQISLDPISPPAGPLDPAPWRDILAGLRARRLAVALCVALAAGQSLLALPVIPLARLAFDRAIPRGDVPMLAEIAIGLAALRVLAGLAVLANRALVVDVKSRVVLGLRRRLLEQLYERPYLAHVQARNPPFAAHMVIDAERVDAMIEAALGAALPAALSALVIGAALMWLNATLCLVGVCLLPLVWLAGRLTARRVRANFDRYHLAFDALARGARFVLETFALTRARGAEPAEIERQGAMLERLRATAAHLAVDNARGALIQSLVVTLAGLAVLVAGGVAVAAHALTPGGLLGFLAAAGLAAAQVDRLIGAVPPLIEGAAALARIHGFLAEAWPAPYAGVQALDWSGRIELEGVIFGYGEGPVLRDVSLGLGPGLSAGVVGPNGAGKTTLINLILGFHRPDQGRLTADGVAYDDLDIRALRRGIGLVPQHPVLFEGTVLENIVYGAPDVSRQDVEAMARRIGADRLIGALPGGLDAPLGEGGLRLSGGERQTVAILRALAARPRLLLLDEPTTHLDADAVRDLIDALRADPAGPGLLLISHDLDVVAGLDGLYRLEGGRLSRR